VLVKTGTVAILAIVLSLLLPSSAQATECSQSSRTSAQCPIITTDINGDEVSVGVSQSSSGSPGGETNQGDSGGIVGAPVTGSPPPSLPPARIVRNMNQVVRTCSLVAANLCRQAPPTSNSSSEVSAPTPPSSARDLASFSPDESSIRVEPANWSLPRLPTNIFSMAGEMVESGELLGWPIQVKFTPSSYQWTYGDGSSATTNSPGGSWGENQFSPRATSHIYTKPGIYDISGEVKYSVSYRFDDGEFVGIPGSITRAGGQARVEVLTVSPLLVDKGCASGSLIQGRC